MYIFTVLNASLLLSCSLSLGTDALAAIHIGEESSSLPFSQNGLSLHSSHKTGSLLGFPSIHFFLSSVVFDNLHIPELNTYYSTFPRNASTSRARSGTQPRLGPDLWAPKMTSELVCLTPLFWSFEPDRSLRKRNPLASQRHSKRAGCA